VLGIEVLHEIGYDTRHESLEAHVPTVFRIVDRAVPLDNPTEVAGARSAQDAGNVHAI
jgi:hypothetical protein